MTMKWQKVKFSVLCIFFASAVYSQTDTLRVKTSAQCSMCRKKLEHNLSYEKGVKSVKLDLNNKVLTIVYASTKTNPEKIRMAIADQGYDADTIPANPKAYNNLQECCKKGGHGD